MKNQKISEAYFFGEKSSDVNIIAVFFAVLDGEIEEIRFFRSEADADAAKSAWLHQWAVQNNVDAENMGEDDLTDAAFDDGYDCYVKSGTIE